MMCIHEAFTRYKAVRLFSTLVVLFEDQSALVNLILNWILGVYLEPSQTSMMELFLKIVRGFQPLTIFEKLQVPS